MEIIVASGYQTAADLALSYKEVLSAKSYEQDGNIVLAILTAPIFLKSERLALISDIKQNAQAVFGGTVYVTIDTGIYRKIKGNLTENEKRALLNQVKARLDAAN